MPNAPASPLVSTQWLADHLDDPGIRIVDVRWCSRYENGRGISLDDPEGYRAGHIPGAVFAAMIADLSDPDHTVPDMIAPEERFASVMGRLGIDNRHMVIAYDNMGFPLGSARLWWALKLYGHDRVRVLDGGLRQWTLEGRQLSTDEPEIVPRSFVPRRRSEWIATKDDVVNAMDRSDTVILDCLTPELYEGRGDRHLWGQRPGHIPGAVNIPYLANISPALAAATASERDVLLAERTSFTMASKEELSELYRGVGIKQKERVIAYCGRGYAAACGVLALTHLGHRDVRLYDGPGPNGVQTRTFRVKSPPQATGINPPDASFGQVDIQTCIHGEGATGLRHVPRRPGQSSACRRWTISVNPRASACRSGVTPSLSAIDRSAPADNSASSTA
ncbi:thiosulfate/3-mercaptopyruvate sulfurtransferase [Ruegeria marina]|uniref:Thiosulfate/3-mercaptopyruvate sulfurtransferase n=1 Tax=Ruegeria marina TaxID=639004 RepID=A0A1G7ETM0_9RHOB|nr:thiosulfate/3-mercaptopyruvate sulfurtransferase [Ruegeria marina]